jgi:hypothetical protein
MPVQVNELVIKAIVSAKEGRGNGAPNSAEAANDRDAIVADCVDRVLEILKEKKER